MSDFHWQDRYDIGVDLMNSHHKKLLQLMDRLQTLSDTNGTFGDLSTTLNELEKYTVFHFAEEEKYMESIAYPKLAVHKGIHKNLLEKLGEHKKNFEKSKKFEANFFDFLNLWLASHICGIDIQYAQHAKSAKKAC